MVPKQGQLWRLLSNDRTESLIVYVIGRSRRERGLAVVAPLIEAQAASGLDVVADEAHAVAVWCFTWVEIARLVEPVGQMDCARAVFEMYRFLATASARPGPTGQGLDPDVARALIEKMRPFTWRGHPEEWAL